MTQKNRPLVLFGGIKIKQPLKIYEKRKDTYHNLLQKQREKINKFSNIRLIIAITCIMSVIFLYLMRSFSLISYTLFAYIIVFTFVVIKHNKLKYNNKYFNELYEVNERALQRLKGDWDNFEDTGLEFKDDNHNFSSDLDIFGQGSLFQYINTTVTNTGRQTLKRYLIHPCRNQEEIIKRQGAINELATKLSWRQRIMAEGMIITDKSNNNEHLYEFFETKYERYSTPLIIIGTRLIPIINIGFILFYFFTSLPYQVFILLLLIQIVFIFLFDYSTRSKNLNLVSKYGDSIKVYSKMLDKIERKDFKSQYLLDLKDKLRDDYKLTAYQQIRELEKIIERISYRRNVYFLPINVMILWDYRCMIALERWKRKSGMLIRIWLDVIGEFEALSSLANMRYDHPDWSIPEITEKPYYVRAKDMGHPLITNNRRCNDLRIDNPTKVLLITGSNMSGKSTYLRTIGINLILAYTGAPVCATDFCCNIFNIYTCMRISDNLEQNTSSFYSELLRIKEIVDASKENSVFFLLDEVFKGTNSQDRHQGAKKLINRLIEYNAIGLVSTHDLELGILEKESNKKIKNYHFKEYYENDKIYFDYRLNPGISKTRNAMYLIRMIGIDD